MPDLNPQLRRQPLNSLATKIIFLVFLSTFLTALVVSWISVHSTYSFLRRGIDETYPAILTATSNRFVAWLDDGRDALVHMAGVARIERSLETRGDPGPALIPMLEEGLARSPFFEALFLEDARGSILAAAGTLSKLPRPVHEAREELPFPRLWAASAGPDGASITVSAAITGHDGRRLGILHGVFRRSLLESLLDTDGRGSSGDLVLVDETGRVQSQARTRSASVGYAISIADLAAGEVREYRSHLGEHLVGAARPLGALDWYLLIEEPFREAFEPVFMVVTRVFVIDVSIILLFSFLAYKITAAIVRPIEALSHGARNIAQGDLDVEIPDTGTHDEIGLLTRTFNDMTQKLLRHHTEIQQANDKLKAQNEELQGANEVLEQLSITDGLTKLHNHRFFQEHLTREIKRAGRTGEALSMLVVDIDDFKRLNDRLGHKAGDEILLGLSRMLMDCIRESDFLARYGGEEFVVLAAETDLEGAVRLAEKIRMCVEEASFIVGDSKQLTKITLSIGAAQYRGSRKSFFQAADQALYRAKGAGKNCVISEDG